MRIGEYMDKQLEMSDRLLSAMERDYNEKDQFAETLIATIRGLLKKIDERDELIADLRDQLEGNDFDDEDMEELVSLEIIDEQTNN